MRIAALYDIHGNLPALEAVLEELGREDVDRIVIGGDVVPGPLPRETIARLRSLEHPTSFIRGNGDREVLLRMRGGESDAVPQAFRESMRWNARQLGPDDGALVGQWPLTLRIEVPGVGRVLFCHATPRDDNEIFTRLTPEASLRPIFDGCDADLVVCGHTHMQHDRMVGATRVVNAGSVGMPFGEPGAYWLLLGPGIELRRTSYDLERAAARLRSTSYPQAEAFASGNVLTPPTEQAILDAFSKVPLRS